MSALQDKLKKISPKQATMVMFAIPVLLVALFSYYVYLPDREAKAKLKSEIDVKESEIAKSQVMKRKLNELKVANKTLQEELKTATERLPSGQEEANFPNVLDQIIADAGLKVKAVAPGPKTAGPSNLYSQIPYTVEVSGTYHQFGKMMEMVDMIQRVVTVQDMNMSSAKLEGKAMNIPAKFTIIAYGAGGGK
jgi:type IV pilus assembly protein PilO